MNSSYEIEIEQREQILQKVRNNIKITPDERLWLVTHSVYNQKWDCLAFNIAVEHLKPNKWYVITIKIESVLYDNRIIPIVCVPAAKGKIVTDLNLTNCKGSTISSKVVKMLGFELNDNCQEYKVDYYSSLGLLSVGYECDYFNKEQNLQMRQASLTGHPDFAMTRQSINDHTVRYCCKSPINKAFDALVFIVEWTEKGSA